jgi:hypothetical protein
LLRFVAPTNKRKIMVVIDERRGALGPIDVGSVPNPMNSPRA